MKYRILSATDKALYQADVLVTVDYTDLQALGAGNTGSFTMVPYGGGDAVVQPYADVASPPTIPLGIQAKMRAAILDTPFTFSDASIVSVTAIIGDGGSSNRYLTSAQIEAAETPITYTQGTGTEFIYVTADNIILALTGTAAHNLNTATAGSLRMFFALKDLNALPLS